MWSKFALVSMVLVMTQAVGAQVHWLSDVPAAQSAAVAAQKDLLVYIADTRSASTSPEPALLTGQEFISAVNKDFIAVKLDVNGNADMLKTLKTGYGLKQAPVFFLLDSAGQPYGRIDEISEGADVFLERLAFERQHHPLVDVSAAWLENYETAQAKAAAQGKHLLMLFTGSDWCPGCIMMESNIFSKAEFEAAIGKDFVLVKFDFPRHKTLPEAVKKQNDKMQDLFAQKHGFRGYPTVYLAYPDGTPYAQVGPVNMQPKAYADMLIKGKQDELKEKTDPAS